ncbi:unnamed protein product [Sympodiomycopsis kandeliae]
MSVVIYVDGACLNNGYPNAQGGWGIHFPNNSHLDAYGPLPGSQQTNNRAELYAILHVDRATESTLSDSTVLFHTHSLAGMCARGFSSNN